MQTIQNQFSSNLYHQLSYDKQSTDHNLGVMRNALQILMQKTMMTIKCHDETTAAINEAQQQQINQAIEGINNNET